MAESLQIGVRYYAVLRERRGVSFEHVRTTAADVRSLYRELCDRHALGLADELVRFSIDGEFVRPDTALSDGVQVALIPPVAGG